MKTFSKLLIWVPLLVAILFSLSIHASDNNSIDSDSHVEARVFLLLRNDTKWGMQEFCDLIDPFNGRNCLATMPISRSVKNDLRTALRNHSGLQLAETLLPILQDALLSPEISSVLAGRIERLVAILTAFLSDTQPNSGTKRSLPVSPFTKTAKRRIQDE